MPTRILQISDLHFGPPYVPEVGEALCNHRDGGIIIVQCGTTTSSRGRDREREENTFNLIEIGPGTPSVIRYMFFEERGEFAPLSQHIFPRPGWPLEVSGHVHGHPHP